MAHRLRTVLVLVLGILSTSMASMAWSAPGTLVIDIGRGPVSVTVPSSYEPGSPLPLILVLHGYGASGPIMANWWQMPARAEEYGFFVAHPEGTVDNGGNRFWNATDACCNFYGSTVDDSQYLLDFIDEIRSQLDVDPDRIYICGHSNGGFMSHRMACDHPEMIAAIGSMAGAVWDDPFACNPGSPVHVLQIHGTSDTVIFYGGGSIGGQRYPGAVESTEYWADVAGCLSIPDTSAPPLDLVTSLPGAETSISRYAEGCAANGSAELWTIAGAPHSPSFNANYSLELVEYFLSHPKQTPAGAGEVATLVGDGVLSCAPNPFSSDTSIELRLEHEASVSVRVVATDGRTVRVITQGELFASGRHQLLWDGRGSSERPLSAGVYFIQATVGDATYETRVVQLER